MFDPSDVQVPFQTVANTFTGPFTAPVQLAGPNPYRVILYLSGTGAAGWNLYLSGDLSRSPSLWPLAGTFQRQFTWTIDGNLPSLGWWILGTSPFSAPKVSVLEVWFKPQGDL